MCLLGFFTSVFLVILVFGYNILIDLKLNSLMTEVPIIEKLVHWMNWFIFDRDLRHERVKEIISSPYYLWDIPKSYSMRKLFLFGRYARLKEKKKIWPINVIAGNINMFVFKSRNTSISYEKYPKLTIKILKPMNHDISNVG